MIEKNVKAEIDLIKEQQQDITGGCGLCVADLAAAKQLPEH
jgi:hypothetical protein